MIINLNFTFINHFNEIQKRLFYRTYALIYKYFPFLLCALLSRIVCSFEGIDLAAFLDIEEIEFV